MELDIISFEGQVTGKAKLPEYMEPERNAKGKLKVDNHLLHEVVNAYLANQRKGTHSTKTRGEVKASNTKPWKQKGTGRARSGRASSPLWRGGGIMFGPKPRSYRIELPQAKIKSALHEALVSKLGSGEVVISEKPKLENNKTKEVAGWMKRLSLPANSLLILDKMDKNLILASRNLADFEIMEWKSIHAYHVLKARKIVLTPEVVKCL